MGIVNMEDVRGVRVDGAVVCLECAGRDFETAEEGDLISDADVDNDDTIYFCDRMTDANCKVRSGRL